MEAAKASNNTLVEVEFDLAVARIGCHCSVYFQHYCHMLPHCLLGVVVSQTGDAVEPYWLSSVEIRSLTSYLNKR